MFGFRRRSASSLYVPLTIAVWREGSSWVSQCVELDIASCGDTPDEAAQEAMDAVCSYVNTLEELGERDAVFAKRSVKIFAMPPESVPLADLPREIADRSQLQVRPWHLPVASECQQPVHA